MFASELGLSACARAIWGKTNRADDSEWLPLYVHMADSAAIAEKIWDTWVPQGTKAVIIRDLEGDENLAKRLMIFLAGVHDIGKATPVFQAKPIAFGPGAESFAWKAEQVGLPMIAGLRDTNHPTHPIAGEVILEGYLIRVHNWDRKAARQYACVVGGHHGTPPDKSKLDDAKNQKINAGLNSEEWINVQDELIDFVANIAGIGEHEWKSLSSRRFSAQSAVLMTGLVIMSDWIASNSDENMFPLVRMEPWMDDETSFSSEGREEDDIQTWSGLRKRADRAWSYVQLPHAWIPEDVPSSCQELFATRFKLPEGAKIRPVQEEAVRIANKTNQPGLMVIEAPMGEGKTEAALAAAEILTQRTGRGGICVALPTMATTDAMFTRVHHWLEALPSCDFANEKTVWLAHGKAQLNNDFRSIIASSHRRFSSMDQDELGQDRSKKQIDMPPETVVSDWLWGRKKGALANFLVCTVDQVLMGALQMKHVVLRQLAMANKVVIIDECHAYDAYMQEYLKMALEWFGGYRTPVILLSATLPERQRTEMVEAYLRGWNNTESGSGNTAGKTSILEALYADGGRGVRNDSSDPVKLAVSHSGKTESATRAISDAYPLLTYTMGHEIKHVDVKPSGRSMNVRCKIVDDDDETLLGLMDALLVDGGCIGVICDTVGRAQQTAELLSDRYGNDYVRLTHSRFMDIDRMSNERELRDLLGPESTIGNRKRPEKLIVVGTQVLEQSLDIDFDALLTDIAPVDLIMQRLGRVHRHHRGEGESDRPKPLQTATCYIRGVETWKEEGPEFAKGVDAVYDVAALMESLAVLDLTDAAAFCMQQLPRDIARTVRSAYGDDPHSFMPFTWLTQYDGACKKRDTKRKKKEEKAGAYLLQSVKSMNQNRSLVDWFSPKVDENDEDKGQRAVRDTQDTVEVMLLHKCGDKVRLLPWAGDERAGVENGAVIPTDVIPDDAVAKVAAQCSVRLPMGLCLPRNIDALIAALEDGCASEAACWQESPWLAGKLALFLQEGTNGFVSSELCGHVIAYSRDTGLTYHKKEDN